MPSAKRQDCLTIVVYPGPLIQGQLVAPLHPLHLHR